jgi:hypothetical protein
MNPCKRVTSSLALSCIISSGCEFDRDRLYAPASEFMDAAGPNCDLRVAIGRTVPRKTLLIQDKP